MDGRCRVNIITEHFGVDTCSTCARAAPSLSSSPWRTLAAVPVQTRPSTSFWWGIKDAYSALMGKENTRVEVISESEVAPIPWTTAARVSTKYARA